MKESIKNEANLITEKQFNRYEGVRKSGVTNMFDVKTVEALSGLAKIEIIAIMEDYENLAKKYLPTDKPTG